ncbi:hypothetical protein PG985_004916 [Apiospora marii]|uniref:uncharacterized protein n=1 Tax=Apiospora marii TaxID=335849 RepID=UPI00312F450A
MINGRVSKFRRRAKISKNLQQQLLAALAWREVESPSNPLQQTPPVVEDQHAQSSKRPLDTTSVIDTVPTKKRRLTPTDGLLALEEAGEERKDLSAQTTLRQPEPQRPKQPYAWFLDNSVDLVYDSTVINWLETIEQERLGHCRSDSDICRSFSPPISRRHTQSVPEMSYTRDNEGYAVPPTPISAESSFVDGKVWAPSQAGSFTQSDFTGATPASGRSSARSLVEDPLYRSINLAANNIHMRPLREQYPEHIAGLVDDMSRDRNSPAPTLDEILGDEELNELWMGTGEPEVEGYFRDHLFSKPAPSDTLKRSERQPMTKHTVPTTGSTYKVSTPVPDMLYGYNRQKSFPQQHLQLLSMGTEMVANNQYQPLLYPFFAIEFKGDGGSMWVATNQCLGDSASCVQVAERLNKRLKHVQSEAIKQIDSAAFSIAMNGTEARLYISWKHNDLDYYMANVRSFLLQDPQHYLEFRKYVRNIIDWGADKRLQEIQQSLDLLLEEGKRKASEVAKTRPRPSASSASSKRRKGEA